MSLQYSCRLINSDWNALSNLYERAGLGNKSEDRLNKVFDNSQYQSFIYIDSKLIGAARAFSDGGDCAVVCDVSICPKFQGKGLGKSLMKHLMEQIPSHERIMLFCTVGLESYYQEFGFGKMTTGMCIFKDQEGAKRSGYIKS